MLLDEHVREYAQRSSGARGPYRPLRGGRMPDMVFTARIPGARRNLPWLFTRYEKAEIDGLTSVHGQLFVKKSKLLTAARAAPAVQCGDPIGDRFSVGGVAIGRPPTATDALYLLKAVLAGKTCQPCVCDIDGSGVVEAVDALRLLKVASGEKVELRCPPCRPGPVQQVFERSKRTSPRPKTVVVQPEPTGARTRVK
jgi:hypothetical protein